MDKSGSSDGERSTNGRTDPNGEVRTKRRESRPSQRATAPAVKETRREGAWSSSSPSSTSHRSPTSQRLIAILGAMLMISGIVLVLQPLFVVVKRSRRAQERQSSKRPSLRKRFGDGESFDGNASSQSNGSRAWSSWSSDDDQLQPPRIVLEPEYENGVLQKRAFSSKMRLVFLVGLEGTGHHYFADALDKMCKRKRVNCAKACKLARVIYPDLSKPVDHDAYKDARKRLRHEMEVLAASAEQLREGKVSMASFGTCRFHTGMMSYPNFNGPDKTLQYVDFRLIAEEAERAGVDVRMVYLSRSARAVLRSDTEHNSYGGTFMKEARILLTNAAVVDSTFEEIGPDFTTCFRYENMSDPLQAARVSEFVSPNNVTAKRLTDTMLWTAKTPSQTKSKREKKVARKHSKSKAAQQQEKDHADRLERAREQNRKRGGLDGDDRDDASSGRVSSKNSNALQKGANNVEVVWDEERGMVTERLQQRMDKIERSRCSWS